MHLWLSFASLPPFPVLAVLGHGIPERSEAIKSCGNHLKRSEDKCILMRLP